MAKRVADLEKKLGQLSNDLGGVEFVLAGVPFTGPSPLFPMNPRRTLWRASCRVREPVTTLEVSIHTTSLGSAKAFELSGRTSLELPLGIIVNSGEDLWVEVDAASGDGADLTMMLRYK
jgi:hypothetical protein